MGIHAAVLDRDFGPLLQVQKLLNSIKFAQTKGHTARLTAAELEMMNLTGDGNGIDLVTMPQSLRERVPTSNFFQRGGYERNGIARRTGTVAALYAEMNGIMDRRRSSPAPRSWPRRSSRRSGQDAIADFSSSKILIRLLKPDVCSTSFTPPFARQIFISPLDD